MRRPFVNLLARGVALATLVYSPTVHAICTHDLDGDGYGSPVGGPSCPAIPDCDEGRPLVNPGVFEDIGTSADDNCNQRSGILPLWMEARFAPLVWVDVGTVTRAAGNTFFDTVKVGTPTGGAASTTRTLAGVPLNVSVAVAAKVSGNIGTGTPCAIRLGTTAPGGGGGHLGESVATERHGSAGALVPRTHSCEPVAQAGANRMLRAAKPVG